MSETQTAATVVTDTQHDGRYIPYGGGCMGWFENSGVLKAEVPNHYTFFSAVDPELVRAKMFERAGTMVNKRRAERKEMTPELPITLKWGKDAKQAVGKDLSIHGMKVQFVNDEVALKKDDKVTVLLHDKTGRSMLMELSCSVMWAEKTGRLRTIWNFGVGFPTLTPEQVEKIKEIGGLTDEQPK
jgi:PilZ domain